ncbi:MAG: methyltransferase domain-containing protein [Patescibacteria group bacterium]|nr:methyltransferase domain-containing protein [Patescibacteria group bacterium]MDD4611079.1 methyltransferase domain-containing protein [Patescibacteria group bacterium]
MRKTNEELEKLIMDRGIFTGEENRRIYEQSFKNWHGDHEYIYKRFGISQEEKMLEIGSAYGQNLIHFSKESIGIEVNNKLVDFSRSLGLKIISLNAEDDLSLITEKYDLIWCTDFLVHMVSPYKFLYDCRNLLKDRGRIVIQIPLMSMFETHRSSCHFYAFNKKSLLYLLEMAGYKIIKTSGLIRKKPRWFNYIFEPLLQIWGGNIWVLAEKEDKTPVNFKKVFLPKWFKA